MKLALILLVLMPLAMSTAVDKRGVLDFMGLGHLIDLNQLKSTVQGILNEVGSDTSEQHCESACHDTLAVDQSNIAHTLCIPICRSFQTLVGLLHLTSN